MSEVSPPEPTFPEMVDLLRARRQNSADLLAVVIGVGALADLDPDRAPLRRGP